MTLNKIAFNKKKPFNADCTSVSTSLTDQSSRGTIKERLIECIKELNPTTQAINS